MVFSLNQILNVSPNLPIAIYLEDQSSLPYFVSMMLKSTSFPLTVPTRTSNGGIYYSLQSSPEFKAMFTLYRIVKRSVAKSVPDRASVHTRNAGFEAVSAPLRC